MSESTKPPSGIGNVNVTNLATFANSRFSIYTVLVALFASLLLISNICATKGVVLIPNLAFELGPLKVEGLITDGAFWIFPFSYVIGDVISEVYGYAAMRRAVLLGFIVTVVAAIAFNVSIHLPAAPFYENQNALEKVVGGSTWILIASIAGFVVGELLNSYVLVRMKRRTGEAKLWQRLLGSTIVGEFFDTTVFCLIAASVIGIETWEGIVNFIVVGFLWKTLLEAAMLPVTYKVIAIIKKAEPTYGHHTA